MSYAYGFFLEERADTQERNYHVNFHYSDLCGLRLDGQTFGGVTFDQATLDKASFQGATLKQASFRSAFIWSSRPMKTVTFDGAMMDKVTYAAIKGLGAVVSKVTVLS